jgi:hypothetical protein
MMHPAVERQLRRFDYGHLPPELAEVSKQFSVVAHYIAENLDGDEVTYCLRDLLRAKDCAVRARVEVNRS